MNLILIGFMGAGKSSVGEKLAEKLGMYFIEMDDLILELSARKTINEIFQKEGELSFRQMEVTISEDLDLTDNAVIATGGGIVLNKINLDFLKKNGIVVFLDTSFEIIEKRLSNDNTRPLFKDKNNTINLYELRLPLYKYYADILVKTDNKSIEEVVNEIILLASLK